MNKIISEKMNLEKEKKIKRKTEMIKLRNEMGILPKKKANAPNPLSVRKKIRKEKERKT